MKVWVEKVNALGNEGASGGTSYRATGLDSSSSSSSYCSCKCNYVISLGPSEPMISGIRRLGDWTIILVPWMLLGLEPIAYRQVVRRLI